MNAIVLAILVMVGLSLARVSVVFALIVATLVGGLYAGMPIGEILTPLMRGWVMAPPSRSLMRY